MKQTPIEICKIPALLWGEASDKMAIAVHGNLSSKSDIPISILAEEAIPVGYQVLSFDLPEHGDRTHSPEICNVQTCVSDLAKIMGFAKSCSAHITLLANSMGAYFSLLAYAQEPLAQCLFLSPVVNMERMIKNMMTWFEISEEQLCSEKEISTPIGQTLSWDYYQYVLAHPIKSWNVPTSILYGRKDTLCEYEVVAAFARQFQ